MATERQLGSPVAPPVSPSQRTSEVLVFVCFFLSGATGLVLELFWIRKLSAIFGSSTLAMSTVLFVFMTGLAIGGWLGGRWVDRSRVHPLRGYAFCEIAVAAGAILFPTTLEAFRGTNAVLWQTLEAWPLALAGARAGLCALLLLPQTVFMGATLPILARGAVTTDSQLGRVGSRVGALYAVNTAGAVLGVLVAGLVLLPVAGVTALNTLAVGLAIFAAGLAWVCARNGVWGDRAVPAAARPLRGPMTARAWIVLGVFALTGGVAMTLEVLMSRALALVLGSASVSYTLVLATFLLGLAFGTAAIGT